MGTLRTAAAVALTLPLLAAVVVLAWVAEVRT